jgi:ABC-type transport system involved in multi-copper enzyme maturation permease subunit
MKGLTASIIAAELLKVRKRWLPYILVLVLVVGAGVLVWLGGYTAWRANSGLDAEERRLALHTFVLPWSLVSLLDTGQFWGSFVVAVLTASMVATEFGWGTARQALVRGQTRRQYLTVKLLGITIMSAAGLLIALAAGIAFSLMATAIAGEPITLRAPGGPAPPGLVLMVLRAGYAVVPYGLLAFCLTVVGRSTALGVAGTLMYMIAEAILLGILHGLGGIAPTVQAFILGHNASAVLSANVIGTENYNSLAFRSNPLPLDLPDPAVGALVIALYCALFLAIAYGVFQRRDLGIESGGG